MKKKNMSNQTIMKQAGKKGIVKRGLAVAICLATAFSLSGCSMLESLFYLRGKSQANKGEIEPDIVVEAPGTNEWVMEDEGYAYEAEVDMSAEMNMMYAGSGKTAMCMPGPGAEYDPIDWNTEEYKYMEENGWLSPETAPFSTFAADVDTASYANVRRMLLEGREVPADAVRIEEMINYFDYDYPSAEGDDPFSVTTQIAPCPWNEDTSLLMIGLKAKEVPARERPASNMVFLIDVSGSMDEYNKLPLVQRAFRLLINELDENDTVSVVTYANSDTIVLEGVPGSEKTTICDAIEDLEPAGGTNGSRGLISAYEIAEQYFVEGGNNRVILATDGDLNIGMTDEGSLARLIEEKAKSGVFLSVLGFGEGNISDTNMEALADHGNGNYSYIDNIGEARKVLLSEAGSNLLTVAKDVKLQVEFNPDKVKGYRLIGYENRLMSAEDFADDTKDGGEIGSGHTVTALYEVAGWDSDFEMNTVESRYRSGKGSVSGTDGKNEIDQGSVSGTDNIDETGEINTDETGITVDEEEIGSGDEGSANMENAADPNVEINVTVKINKTGEDGETEQGQTGKTDPASSEEKDGSSLANEWGILHIRYKEPDGDESILMDTIIDDDSVRSEMDDNLSWAAGVAQAGMILKQSEYAGTTDLAQVRERLKTLTGNDEFREEFVYLLTRM